MASGKDSGICCTIDFRQSDEHRRFNRTEPPRGICPLAERQEFERVCGDVRNIERRQCFDCSFAVVVGRSSDKTEPGQRYENVNLAFEIGFNRRSAVQSSGEGGQALQPCRLEIADDRIVVGGVGCQHIGPHH